MNTVAEEREEAQQISADQALMDAERLLRMRKDGVLCTISKRVDGWPFGSIVPYALDPVGRPIILIASIAEHTRNLEADARVSLLVQAQPLSASSSGDVQAAGRLTMMGRAERVPQAQLEDARARYLARLPEAAGYFGTHSFVFYRIEVERLRYIGGFGKIFWLAPERYQRRFLEDPLRERAASIIEHMNTDHAEALLLYCQAFKGLSPQSAVMTGVDRWGFDVRCEEPKICLRFDFEEPAGPENIRALVVAMVAQAKKIVKEARHEAPQAPTAL